MFKKSHLLIGVLLLATVLTACKKEAVFNQAVVYSKTSTFWQAKYIEENNDHNGFKDFTVTEEAFGGVSMFFPQTKHNDSPYYKHNELIKQMAWYYAVGWSEVGW